MPIAPVEGLRQAKIKHWANATQRPNLAGEEECPGKGEKRATKTTESAEEYSVLRLRYCSRLHSILNVLFLCAEPLRRVKSNVTTASQPPKLPLATVAGEFHVGFHIEVIEITLSRSVLGQLWVVLGHVGLFTTSKLLLVWLKCLSSACRPH